MKASKEDIMVALDNKRRCHLAAAIRVLWQARLSESPNAEMIREAKALRVQLGRYRTDGYKRRSLLCIYGLAGLLVSAMLLAVCACSAVLVAAFRDERTWTLLLGSTKTLVGTLLAIVAAAFTAGFCALPVFAALVYCVRRCALCLVIQRLDKVINATPRASFWVAISRAVDLSLSLEMGDEVTSETLEAVKRIECSIAPGRNPLRKAVAAFVIWQLRCQTS